jgi:hypothetical protein
MIFYAHLGIKVDVQEVDDTADALCTEDLRIFLEAARPGLAALADVVRRRYACGEPAAGGAMSWPKPASRREDLSFLDIS